MSVRCVCPRCAARYSGVVDPACPICDGAGTFGVAVPDGVPPVVAVRAAGMMLGASTMPGWGCSKDPAPLRASPLWPADTDGPVGLPAHSQGPAVDPSAIGRAAGRLLDELKLRQRKPRKPAKRRTKSEIEREKAAKRAQTEAMERHMREYREKHERRELEVAVNARLAEAYEREHPEEYAETVERETAYVGIEKLGKVLPFDIRVMRR